jgi:hypothetical protein
LSGDVVEIDGCCYDVVSDKQGGVTLELAITKTERAPGAGLLSLLGDSDSWRTGATEDARRCQGCRKSPDDQEACTRGHRTPQLAVATGTDPAPPANVSSGGGDHVSAGPGVFQRGSKSGLRG